MKKLYSFLVIALLITTMVACKKDKEEDNSPDNDLVSFWELEQTSSSMPTKTYEPGNGNILRIYNDGTYSYSKDGQVTEHGNFSVIPDDSVEENVCMTNLKDKYKNRFEVSNVIGQYLIYPVGFKTYFYIADDKLYMIGGCFALDAGALRIYRRANPRAID